MEAFMEHELTNVLVISSMIYICINHPLKRLIDSEGSQLIFGKNQQSTRLSMTILAPTLTDTALAPTTCQIILQKYTPILGVYLT